MPGYSFTTTTDDELALTFAREQANASLGSDIHLTNADYLQNVVRSAIASYEVSRRMSQSPMAIIAAKDAEIAEKDKQLAELTDAVAELQEEKAAREEVLVDEMPIKR